MSLKRRDFLRICGAAAAAPAAVTGALHSAADPSLRWRETLDSRWLFQPEQALNRGIRPQEMSLSDGHWPEIDVPAFWRPNEYWLWDRKSMASAAYWQRELDRVARYQFDAYGTQAGWYRKWIELPESGRSQRVFLRFWGVAMIAQVWWNGQPVGSHLGMFGPFVCEVTKAVRPGRNLLTLFVAGGRLAQLADRDVLKGRGVTVDVASPWLNALPQSCFWMCGANGGGGIWQSVEIWGTDACQIDDVFFRPRLDGGSLEVTVDNGSTEGVERLLRFSISDRQTAAVLARDLQPVRLQVGGQTRQTVTVELPRTSPVLWSPGDPHLYDLSVELWDGNVRRDAWRHKIGFRTMRVEGTHFLLNEKRYFLRGATMPPFGIAPCDRDLAFRYLELLRAGNQVISAFNETGANDIWCDAADEIGIGMIDQGAWTWGLSGLTNSDDPASGLIEAWKKSHTEMVLAVRNHPSILLRSINDEMWFHYLPPRAMANPPDSGQYFDPDAQRRLRKWQILSDVIQRTRQLDDTRPIGASGGYARTAEEWTQLEPLKIDDGDFDNIHVFHGTYGPSYLAIDVARDIEERYSMGKRPLISDQAGTGYPDNDIGYPISSYVNNHMVPQAWMGSYIHDPRLSYLDINGQIIKEGLERVRCQRAVIAGWLMFSNCQWFKNVYDARRIKPYTRIYDGVARALSPMLIALGTALRRFTAEEKISLRFTAVHDDLSRGRVDDLRVVWTWRNGPQDLAGGEARMPPLDYYGIVRSQAETTVPAVAGGLPMRGRLEIALFSGSDRIAWNDYPVLIAPRAWYRAAEREDLAFLLIGGDPSWSAALSEVGVSLLPERSVSWGSLSAEHVVIMPEEVECPRDADALKAFVARGGRVLFHNPSPATAQMLGLRCEPIDTHFRHHIWDTPAGPWGAEYVDVAALHPVAAGLDPVYDMRWWNPSGDTPPCVSTKVLASTEGDGAISILGTPGTDVCTYTAPHGYFRSPWDFHKYFFRPVASEASIGRGRVMVGCFRLATDPVSRRFLLNVLRYCNSFPPPGT